MIACFKPLMTLGALEALMSVEDIPILLLPCVTYGEMSILRDAYQQRFKFSREGTRKSISVNIDPLEVA